MITDLHRQVAHEALQATQEAADGRLVGGGLPVPGDVRVTEMLLCVIR